MKLFERRASTHHGSHAVFVRWQRESVEVLGTILNEAQRNWERGSRRPAHGSKSRRGNFATTRFGGSK